MATTDRTTVTLPKDLHEEVFGEDGLKPHATMANYEFIEEMATTYERGERTVSDPVEMHRDTLEALAEHGHTELAEDARTLLDAAESED